MVIQTKQHLAALIPAGDALVLNLMRWGDEVKAADDLDLPKSGAKATSPTASELKMARMLVEDMSGHWDPGQYKDEFKAAVMDLVARKVRAGTVSYTHLDVYKRQAVSTGSDAAMTMTTKTKAGSV